MWLENNPDRPSDAVVWGEMKKAKGNYSFLNLARRVQQLDKTTGLPLDGLAVAGSSKVKGKAKLKKPEPENKEEDKDDENEDGEVEVPSASKGKRKAKEMESLMPPNTNRELKNVTDTGLQNKHVNVANTFSFSVVWSAITIKAAMLWTAGCSMLRMVLCMPSLLGIMILLSSLPTTMAASNMDEFPNISFDVFADFVQAQFSLLVSLATVLSVLFSLLDNPDLLNLHNRQNTGTTWKGCHRAFFRFSDAEDETKMSDSQQITSVSTKLNSLARLLQLRTFNSNGKFIHKLKPVSRKKIAPALILCPVSMACTTATCGNQSLLLETRKKDLSRVTLIKRTQLFTNVFNVYGKCRGCKTTYYADHERIPSVDDSAPTQHCYLNREKILQDQADFMGRSAVRESSYE